MNVPRPDRRPSLARPSHHPAPRRLRGLASAAVALGALVGPAAAQKTSANIEADLAFARGLASKWSFVDLAEEVIKEVESGRLEADQAASLALLRCEIYTVGARNERDPLKRNDLFKQALSCLDGYITANPYAANKGDAEEAFVSTSQLYARSLEIAAQDAIGEEATKLNDERIAVLSAGVKRTGELIDALTAIPSEERSEKQIGQRFELMLQRGQMYATISAAQKSDPFFKEQAIKVLEDLVFEAGEGTPFALRGYSALGDVYAGNGEYETAASYYDGVSDQVIPFDPSVREEQLGWSEMPQPQKARRFLFVELAMPGILSSYLNYGDTATALERAMFFWNMHRKESLDLSQFGYDALLQIARVMLASDGYLGGDLAAGQGEWFATEEEMTAKYKQRRLQSGTTDFALQLANQVAKDAEANAQKTAAGKLIAEIGQRPGVQISIGQLFEAASAKYRDQDFAGARAALNQVLVAMDALEPAARVEYGAKAYNLLGNILRGDGRELEAAMAFREGALNWSDPEFDEKNAKGYQFLVARLAKAAGEDPDMRALLTEAEAVVIQKGGAGGGSISFTQGKRAQDKEEWAAAIEAYGKVTEADAEYEVAYVNLAVCMFRAGQVNDALGRLDTYLNTVRVDPKRATESPSALALRKGASATAEFYRGFITHAIADAKYKRSQDASGFPKVVEYLTGFEERYPEQASLCTLAMNRVVDAHAKLGQADKAQAQLDAMVAKFPDDKQTGAAAVALYKTYEGQHKAAKDGKATAEQLAPLERNMARALNVSNRIAASPTWSNLKQEGDLWFGLADWTNAKAAYARLSSKFADDDANKSTLERNVLPNLAFCMLQLRELNDARDLLSPLVRTEGAKPTKNAVQYYAMAVTGWLEGGVTGITVVPGAGGTEEEFKYVTDKLTSIQKSGSSWTSCEWYEDKFAELYAFYVWGQTDSRKLDTAKNLVNGTQPFIENDVTFAVVDQYCSEDAETPADLKARLGSGTLRARYQWLWSKTR